MAPFEYTAIGRTQIRVLRIHPGSFDEEVSCDALIVDLETHPKYRAISYTWGDAVPLHEILIDGRQFSVRSNCLYALRQAKHFSNEDELIWIDAICINQDDIAEKGQQVSMMGTIYKQASQVYSCIGEISNDEEDVALDLLVRQSNTFETLWKSTEGEETCATCIESRFEGSDKRVCHVSHLWMATITADDLYGLYDASDIISQSSYWTRLWVVQEVFLPQDVRVLCNRKMVWFQFLIALGLVKQHINGNDIVLKRIAVEFDLIVPSRPEILRMPQGDKLFSLCLYRYLGINEDISRMHLKGLGCADPRDRIYGLLHLQSWPKATGPPIPNYFKSRLELINDYFNHRGLGAAWYAEVGELLDVLGVPDSECWKEVKSSLYVDNAAPPVAANNPTSSSRGCTCEHPSMPGRFRISGPCKGYYVLKDHANDLRTCLRSFDGAMHTCPSIRAYTDFQSFLTDDERTQSCEILSILGDCRDGDVLLPLDTHNFHGYRGAVPPVGLGHNAILVLRKTLNGYWAVVGFSLEQAISICDSKDSSRCLLAKAEHSYKFQHPEHIEIYSSVEDVVAFVLHKHALKSMGQSIRSGQAKVRPQLGAKIFMRRGLRGGRQTDSRPQLDYPPEETSDFRFPCLRYSTFGMPLTSNHNLQDVEPTRVSGLPSFDTTTMLCAVCGGLHEPSQGDRDIDLSDLSGTGPFTSRP